MWKFSAFLFFTIILTESCVHNKIRYILDKNELMDSISEYPNHPPDYLVQKKDILYVRVNSSNKEINQLFVSSGSQLSNSAGMEGNFFYLNGYVVNDSGRISLPVIGNIQVEGKTMYDIRKLLKEKVDERINNADIMVSLVSFNLTFIGEFNSQGRITVLQDNVNIIEAIALAGGISDYGNKKNVLVVRQTENGAKTFRVDLTKRNLLTSDKYYLLPNDMVIAEPLKSKSFQLGVRDYSLILTTVTSTITMVLLVINLLK